MEIKTTRTIEGVNLLPLSIIDLYDFVATTLGYDKEEVHYDCTKIEVSDDIADLVEEKYRQVGQEKGLSEDSIRMSFGMDWCCNGPKVNEELDNGTIVVYDGFISETAHELIGQLKRLITDQNEVIKKLRKQLKEARANGNNTL